MQSLVGHTLIDRDGEEIGEITDLILEPRTLEPDLATVKPGRLRAERLIPVDALEVVDDVYVRTDFTREEVKTAPRCHDHRAPTPDERAELEEHFGSLAAAPPQVH